MERESSGAGTEEASSFLWRLKYPVGKHFRSLAEYALQDRVVDSCSPDKIAAVRKFLSSALAVILCLSPKVAVRFLELNNAGLKSLRVSVTPTMLIAVLGFGFGIGGSLSMLNMTGIPGSPPRDTTEAVFTLLLDGCGDQKLMQELDKNTLQMIADRFKLVSFSVLLDRVEALMISQSVLSASARDSGDGDGGRSVNVADFSAWHSYASLVLKVRRFVGSLSPASEIVPEKAERDLSSLMDAVAAYRLEHSCALTRGMLHAAVQTQAPRAAALTSHKNAGLSVEAISQRVQDSVYRDYCATLLGAACAGDAGEREGEEGLELYLSLRSRLIQFFLEASGCDVNIPSLEKGPHGNVVTPQLPIDMLQSPTLLTVVLDTCARLGIPLDLSRSVLLINLVGGNWCGCRLGSGSYEETDPYLPRYELLKKVLGGGGIREKSFPPETVAEAIQVAMQSVKQLTDNIKYARTTQTNLHAVDLATHGVNYAKFALPLLREYNDSFKYT
eukprot:g19458.t1